MTSATVDNAISLLDEMNEQGRIEYADYSQLHDAIAATLGQGTLTAEDVRSFLNRNSVFDDTTWTHGRQELVFDEDDLQAMADELNATLGHGMCRNEWAEFGMFRCSKCWMQVISVSTNTTAPRPIKFCPNCGREVVGA